MINKKIFKSLWFWLAALLALYALLGFFYAHKPLGNILTTQLKEQTGLDLKYEKLAINPFTFSIELTDFVITDTADQEFIKAKGLFTNFNPSKLLFKTYEFSELKLEQPEVALAITGDHQISLPLLALPATEDTATENSETQSNTAVDLRIDRIDIDKASVHLKADNINQDFDLSFKQLAFNHKQFNLGDIDSTFELQLITTDDEQIDFSGVYNHLNQKLSADIALTNGQSSTLAGFIPEDLSLALPTGTVDVKGHIEWLLTALPVVDLAHFDISNFTGQWSQNITAENMHIRSEGIHIDLNQQRIKVKTVAANKGTADVFWPMTFNETTDESQASTEPWHYQVDQVTANEIPVTLIDNNLTAQVSHTIENLQVDNIGSEPQETILSLLISGTDEGELSVTGNVQLTEPSINTLITAKSLALKPYNPWLIEHAGLQLSKGTLSTEQDFSLLKDETWHSEGQLALDDLQLENKEQQLIASVGQLNIDKNRIDSIERSIHIDQITLDKANGQLLLDENSELNIKHVGQASNSNQEVSDEVPATDEDWQITVGTFNIKDSSTALTDQSIAPQVKTEISEINGKITELSSVATDHATVDINAKLNQFSPIKISGTINPLSESAYTDLDIVIKDLDLLTFSSYAANGVNFPIDGGQLNLQLNYLLNNKSLKGDNKFIFKQFKLGNKLSNPDAMNLPLKFAVTLLTDGNNEMHINLPVSGQIDDPEFNVGGIVFKAFIKLITGIVASPFNLLGKLIPNPRPDMNEIQFPAGSAEVAGSERLKLEQIGQIINQKPALKLQMRVSHNDDLDRSAIQQNKLLAQAPFEEFDATNEAVINWLTETHENPETVIDESNAQAVWQEMVNSESVTAEQLTDLQQQRYNQVKQLLVESYQISADKIFQLSHQNQSETSSELIISVSN